MPTGCDCLREKEKKQMASDTKNDSVSRDDMYKMACRLRTMSRGQVSYEYSSDSLTGVRKETLEEAYAGIAEMLDKLFGFNSIYEGEEGY